MLCVFGVGCDCFLVVCLGTLILDWSGVGMVWIFEFSLCVFC